MFKYLEFEVALLGIEPKIWRLFRLPAGCTFLELHRAIQDACGWEDYHLFRFETPDREAIAGIPHEEWGEPDPDAATVKATSYFDTADRCIYVYDFGDNWEHQVTVLAKGDSGEPFHRQIVDGARAFPPEDCGGVWGYEECVRVARGGDDPKDLADWLGGWDPDRFDLRAAQSAFDR